METDRTCETHEGEARAVRGSETGGEVLAGAATTAAAAAAAAAHLGVGQK